MSAKLTREELEQHIHQAMEHMFAEVPFAMEFHGGQTTHLAYYKRHLMETVLRIRLNNEVDAYALYKIGYSHNALAQKLAQYLAEEYGHEHMFLRDLKKLGVTENELNSTQPFFSTRLLIGYLYHSINQDGPMPTMVWNWFVEWYSDNYNLTITQKAAETFGAERVRGSMTHLTYDDSHDHLSLMFGTVAKVMQRPGDAEKVTVYASEFVKLVGMYFRELYEATIAADASVAA
jgi:hypothetical protein